MENVIALKRTINMGNFPISHNNANQHCLISRWTQYKIAISIESEIQLIGIFAQLDVSINVVALAD